MVKTIDDLLSYKDELEETKEKLRKVTENNGTADLPDTRIVPDNDAIADKEKITGADDAEEADGRTDEPCPEACEETVTDTEEEEKNRMLFEKLDDTVTRGKLYLNPDLSREDFVKLTGVNKNQSGKDGTTEYGAEHNGIYQ